MIVFAADPQPTLAAPGRQQGREAVEGQRGIRCWQSRLLSHQGAATRNQMGIQAPLTAPCHDYHAIIISLWVR